MTSARVSAKASAIGEGVGKVVGGGADRARMCLGNGDPVDVCHTRVR